MLPPGCHRAYLQARGRLGTWKNEQLAPAIMGVGARLNRSTTAVLEYPFEPRARWGWDQPRHAGLAELFDGDLDRYRETIRSVMGCIPHMAEIPVASSPGEPCWDNVYWSGLDGLLLYATVVERDPRTYLEVGSGNSTLFVRKAVRDHGLRTEIVSIDPHPRADVDALCDRVERHRLQDADLSLFDGLSAGDVVLLDGTHTVFMNSDTAVAFLDVLPRLPAGVIVAIHDIFLPWDYPPEWTDRWYGEQYLVGALLLARSPDWVVRFPAFYASRHPELAPLLAPLQRIVPDPPGIGGSSLWLERI